ADARPDRQPQPRSPGRDHARPYPRDYRSFPVRLLSPPLLCRSGFSRDRSFRCRPVAAEAAPTNTATPLPPHHQGTSMLTALGFGMVITFMYLIMSKRLSPLV
ncbi:hypothetical protein FK492_24775, partial [Pantoea dispersa]